MKKILAVFLLFLFLVVCMNCSNNRKDPFPDVTFKKGPLVFCGPGEQFGSVDFDISCDEAEKKDFELGVKLLHSFEYDEAEKVFAKIIEQQPGCAMAYWGVAMSNFHPLWTPPTEPELKKGLKAVTLAQAIETTKRERAYIDAIAAFYRDWEKTDHYTRCLRFEEQMEKVYKEFPADKEAAIFYALSLDAAASPGDKSFTRQKKAGAILTALYANNPKHPGIAHYLIHTYDYPALAEQGLVAARSYASVAPSSAHALHMPSHIFTRLGLWDECIRSNQASVSSARCYAEAAGIKGHWDEELHGLDYLEYAYLQKGENDSAKQQYEYLQTIKNVYPINFKVAYAFAAIPSRYVLENKLWQAAASLKIMPANFPWKNFPWQQAILHFAILMGSIHTNDIDRAKEEMAILQQLHDTLVSQKDSYKAGQVEIQIKTAGAWMRLSENKPAEALLLMQQSTDMEDQTEKHPVTPGEVIPAREFLGDMLLAMNDPVRALAAYEKTLQTHPNRFNALYGAGLAAQKSGNSQKSSFYFQQLFTLAGNSKRPEMAQVLAALKGS